MGYFAERVGPGGSDRLRRFTCDLDILGGKNKRILPQFFDHIGTALSPEEGSPYPEVVYLRRCYV